ncbi:outer membrane protein TolC [Edaphobacter aggregans]|uniref:Outer membrane protein TolC n=1 Tax=Edaphobacter aggregans TaxID=570835 RepID=A0A428MIH2_9BACT|nr:TolC family protein [Edaphobacter aggregans]RSL16676.1 outer membrane protein TolC [Edaphobacter aggregans]
MGNFSIKMTFLPVAVVCLGLSGTVQAQKTDELPQAPTPNVVVTKLAGDVLVERATPGALPLSLDDAIERGLKKNLQILLSQQNERYVHGQVLTVKNSLLPSMTAQAQSSAQQINLAALGFKGTQLADLGFTGPFNPIVRVDTTSAQMKLNQQLFNVPAYYLYRAAQKADTVASLSTLNQRGSVTLAVGTQYLLALADASQIENERALVKANEVALQQAKASHEAGVGTHLDELRARVQLQTEQQSLINAENTFAKDKIALNRLIGLPAEQELTLTDTAPFAEFAEMPLEQAKALAFERRKDLLSLQAQMDVADRTLKAVRAERYPSLAFDGYYGVLGETQGLYHGVFSAMGKLSFPIFQEAQLRGESQVARAQVTGLRQQIDSLKVTIEQQIRASMLDVQASNELVKVAKSNVDLATEQLQQATDRFAAGVDDNLPVVQAQATLAAAQSRLVNTLYQYNQSKLQLARNTGVVETQYKVYLGR